MYTVRYSPEADVWTVGEEYYSTWNPEADFNSEADAKRHAERLNNPVTANHVDDLERRVERLESRLDAMTARMERNV